MEDHPEMPHWNDAPTGQVPAILDSTIGEEQAVAPPMWREEETDWEAQEEVFEPSMLSDDLPAVGALLGERDDEVVDVERQPWHFESDDTLVIPPEPGFGYEAIPEPEPEPDPVRSARQPEHVLVQETEYESEFEPLDTGPRAPVGVTAATTAAAASRLSPPQAPEPKTRAARTSRSNGNAVRTGNVNTAGTAGRDMRVAIGSGVLLGAIALACFAAGTVASMVIVCIVILLATAEAFAAFRRAQYHPATLLGLVAVLSLLIETYNKGVAALPPRPRCCSWPSTPFILSTWSRVRTGRRAGVGHFVNRVRLRLDRCLRLVRRAAPQPEPVPGPPRHRLPAGRRDRHGGRRRGLTAGRRRHGTPSTGSVHQRPEQRAGGLIGGAIAAILVAVVVVHFIHPWTVSKAALYGVVVAIVAPLGDLSQSMIKRHLGLKDMGRLLPGHGGILDRVDGLLFVMPATYFVVKAMHLG